MHDALNRGHRSAPPDGTTILAAATVAVVATAATRLNHTGGDRQKSAGQNEKHSDCHDRLQTGIALDGAACFGSHRGVGIGRMASPRVAAGSFDSDFVDLAHAECLA